MKFDFVIEEALKKTELKKVRFVTDPRDRHTPTLSTPYEGYVIEENEGMLKVLMVKPENPLQSIVDIAMDQVEPADGNSFEQFKRYVLDYLHAKNKCDYSEATIHNIAHAGDMQHLETFVKEQGVDNDEFIKIIKNYVTS